MMTETDRMKCLSVSGDTVMKSDFIVPAEISAKKPA